jgi:hypothetical protein
VPVRGFPANHQAESIGRAMARSGGVRGFGTMDESMRYAGRYLVIRIREPLAPDTPRGL